MISPAAPRTEPPNTIERIGNTLGPADEARARVAGVLLVLAAGLAIFAWILS